MGQVQCCTAVSQSPYKFKEQCIDRINKLGKQTAVLKDIQSIKPDPKTNLIFKKISNSSDNNDKKDKDLVIGVLYRPGRVLYYGDIKNGMANGSGLMIWKFQEAENIAHTITEYQGHFQNNNAQGKGTFSNSQIIFHGTKWDKGFPRAGKLEYKDEQKFPEIHIKNLIFDDDTFTRGKLEIRSKQFTYAGGIAKIGNQYLYDGEGKMFFLHTQHWYQGDWKQGKYHGSGNYCWSDDKQFNGMYEYGLKNGLGALKDKDLTYKGSWKAGLKQGKFQIIKQNTLGTMKYFAQYEKNSIKLQ